MCVEVRGVHTWSVSCAWCVLCGAYGACDVWCVRACVCVMCGVVCMRGVLRVRGVCCVVRMVLVMCAVCVRVCLWIPINSHRFLRNL